jgi:hypothetical protein
VVNKLRGTLNVARSKLLALGIVANQMMEDIAILRAASASPKTSASSLNQSGWKTSVARKSNRCGQGKHDHC